MHEVLADVSYAGRRQAGHLQEVCRPEQRLHQGGIHADGAAVQSANNGMQVVLAHCWLGNTDCSAWKIYFWMIID